MTSTKLIYFVRIEVEASFATTATICTLQKRWTLLSWLLLGPLRKAIYITKVSRPKLRVAIANSFFLINSTCLIVERAFLVI